jgi:enoyl-CoA hydratase/carnithine racemase
MLDVIDHGQIRELRLNRPPVNALDPELLAAIRDGVTAAPDEGAAAMVLSGTDGMFSAGLDVKVLLKLDERQMEAAVQVFFETMEALTISSVPIAVAITGHSPAGGAVLAIFCDWRVMADGPFSIGFNEVQIGITVPTLVHAAVARAAGSRRAETLCVTGTMMDPCEALSMGVVDQVVTPPEVVSTALQWCESVVALPPRAMRRTRTMAREELVDFVRRNRERAAHRFFSEWLRPETQGPLRELVERLEKK